jgi:hypothetical protein
MFVALVVLEGHFGGEFAVAIFDWAVELFL